MEKSYIQDISFDYLFNLGFSKEQIQRVNELVNQGIKEKLYTKSRVPYHNMKHIEKVIMYSLWIVNEKRKNGEMLDNIDILLLAALYHDCGRKWQISNKIHGVVGADIASKKLKGSFDDKTIHSICLLIETHAKIDDTVDFKGYKYTLKEKKQIQELSDILKDADALDRNRIRLFSFARCDVNRLRTPEAKIIYQSSNQFFNQYEKAIQKSLV